MVEAALPTAAVDMTIRESVPVVRVTVPVASFVIRAIASHPYELSHLLLADVAERPLVQVSLVGPWPIRVGVGRVQGQRDGVAVRVAGGLDSRTIQIGRLKDCPCASRACG